MTKKILPLFLMVVALSGFLPAEEKGEKGQALLRHEVVVTATRIETPSKEVASSITVISREDLEQAKNMSLLEVLEEVPGLETLQNGGCGAAASVLVRGSNSEHVLIMMDGVELNDPMSPSRSFDLAHLPLDNIERIEILRGPQSTLYGSDALGGVINIITKRGRGKIRTVLEANGGSYGTLGQRAGLSGSSGPVDFSLGVSHFTSRGISAAGESYPGNKEADSYRNLAFSGRLGLSLKNNIDMNLILRAVTAKTDLDNFGGPYGDDPNNTQNYESLFLKWQVRSLLLKNRWEQNLAISFIISDRRHKNATDDIHVFDSERGQFKSHAVKVDWQNNLFLHSSNTLTFGLDLETEHGESEYFSDGLWGPYSSLFPPRKAIWQVFTSRTKSESPASSSQHAVSVLIGTAFPAHP